MKTKINLVIFLLLISNIAISQTNIKCAHKKRIAYSNSEYVNKKNAKLNTFYNITNTDLIKIPVVIHVIHHEKIGNGINGVNPFAGNISNEQILSQIRVLNEDYRRKKDTPGFNSLNVGADMNIEFYLAQIDPEGKPTTGIIRVFNPKESYDVFEDNFLLSDLSYWDSAKYLNIWVTSIADNYLGFGEFPGGELDGLELEDVDARIDGIIIDHNAFGYRTGTAREGIYTFGRTLTHEIGHWLGLLHTWGDEFCGNDYCDDTPKTERGNLSINCTPTTSECDGSKTVNMIENYMDYSPDSCMNVFTENQKNRVRTVFEVSKRRKSFLLNTQTDLQKVESLTVKIIENPSSDDFVRFQILIKNSGDFYYTIHDLLGHEYQRNEFKQSESTQIQLNKNIFSKGIFILKVFYNNKTIEKRLLII